MLPMRKGASFTTQTSPALYFAIALHPVCQPNILHRALAAIDAFDQIRLSQASAQERRDQ